MTADTTSATSASFELTDQPWLPVLFEDGREDVLSLRDAFARAGEIRRLVGDVPTQEFALVRLLLAIVHDAVDGPEDTEAWQELWHSDEPFAPVAAYLDQHRECFDLLHPETPFFQVAEVRTGKDEVASLNRIVADVPNGEPFFTMRFPGVDRISFAEAARWLVHAHAFDTSGIKTAAVGDPRAKGGKVYPQGVGWAGNLGGVYVEGSSLRETLLLNLVAADAEVIRVGDDDRPAWRRRHTVSEADDLAERPSGPRDLYTWQSRRVRLHHDGRSVHGVVLCYGDPLSPHNRHRDEPMSAWRRSTAQEKKLGKPLVYLPVQHDPARAAWRGLQALIAPRSGREEGDRVVRPPIMDWLAHLVLEEALPRDRLFRARTAGAVYGTQQSVIDDLVEDNVTMAVVLLHESDRRLGDTAVQAVEDADRAVQALGTLAGNLAAVVGTDAGPHEATAKNLGYGALDAPFRDWLSELRPDSDPVAERHRWQKQAHRIIRELGDQLVSQAGVVAWEGRITDDGDWHNASWAELRFRRDLARALPNSHGSE